MNTRQTQFQALFPDEKPFRWRQIEQALFRPEITGWKDITVLTKAMREFLEYGQDGRPGIPWMSLTPVTVLESSKKDTYKAIVQLEDGAKVETVLMANRRGQWTICVSSQVGCAMGCGFCATGKMGLARSLTPDEIVDQYRFWQNFLKKNPNIRHPADAEYADMDIGISPRISNVVFMGMGEPLANYENVKSALRVWLANTDIGPTHLTVSTVGLLPLLNKILEDPDWPPVRLAVSLHSANPKTRKDIVPTSHDQFLPLLQAWGRAYLERFGNRRHHLTFEYVMLKDVNDTDEHAKILGQFVRSIGDVKVNLIPYNFTDSEFRRSDDSQIHRFKEHLESQDIPVMVRKTMGDDIAAACGQLITLGNR